jgi:hypothetical protein
MLCRNFFARDNGSVADRLNVRVTDAVGRSFPKPSVIGLYVSTGRDGFPRPGSQRDVLAEPAPDRPKRFALRATISSPSATPLSQQLSPCFKPVGISVARQRESPPPLGNKVCAETNFVVRRFNGHACRIWLWRPGDFRTGRLACFFDGSCTTSAWAFVAFFLFAGPAWFCGLLASVFGTLRFFRHGY